MADAEQVAWAPPPDKKPMRIKLGPAEFEGMPAVMITVALSVFLLSGGGAAAFAAWAKGESPAGAGETPEKPPRTEEDIRAEVLAGIEKEKQEEAVKGRLNELEREVGAIKTTVDKNAGTLGTVQQQLATMIGVQKKFEATVLPALKSAIREAIAERSEEP